MGTRFDSRDGPMYKVNERIETLLKGAISRPWTKKRSMAVYRGEMRKDTWASGLPDGVHNLAVNVNNWRQYGRGKLLALRQEKGAGSLLNINIHTSDWSKEERNQMGLNATVRDEPAWMSMVHKHIHSSSNTPSLLFCSNNHNNKDKHIDTKKTENTIGRAKHAVQILYLR